LLFAVSVSVKAFLHLALDRVCSYHCGDGTVAIVVIERWEIGRFVLLYVIALCHLQ
jgi:hypothetical protein